MKLAIGRIPLDFGEGNEVLLQVRAPARPKSVAFVLEKKLISVANRPEYHEQLALFIETSSDGPLHNRRFVKAATNRTVGIKAGVHIEYVGTAISPLSMEEVHIYEVHES